MKDEIGFIGLGLLGLPIAANLLDAGYALRVHNRTASKAQPLVERGATLAERAVDVIRRGGIVVSVLWDDASLESVVDADGFLEKLGPGGVHISVATVSPAAAARIAEKHEKQGASYVAAPVFGRPEAAAARKLWMPIAGPQIAKERVRPVLEAMGAQGIFDFGEQIGTATAVKLAGNFLLISAARSLDEAFRMAESNGVDTHALLDMLHLESLSVTDLSELRKNDRRQRPAIFDEQDTGKRSRNLRADVWLPHPHRAPPVGAIRVGAFVPFDVMRFIGARGSDRSLSTKC